MKRLVKRRAAVVLAMALGCAGTPSPAPPTVELLSPSGAVSARGPVEVELRVGGGAVDAVELLRDGAVLARLAPPYAYTWNTTADPEGPHELRARARGPGGVAESGPVTVLVDRTAPRVALRDPGPGRWDVAVRTRLRIRFDEPILPASVTPAALVLTGPGGTPLTAAARQTDAMTLEVDLPSVEPPATLTATAGAGLTDRAGNPAEPTSWSFTLPRWAPLGGELSSPGWNQGVAPAVVADPAGVLWCVWIRLDPAPGIPQEAGNVVVQRWVGGAWEQVGPALDVGPHDGLGSPDIAIDPSGAPVVLWADMVDRHVVRWNGQAWIELGSSADFAQPSADFSFLGSGPGGLLVGWSGWGTGGAFESLAKRWDGAAWQAVGARDDLMAGSVAEYGGAHWMAGFTGGEARVRRWDGALWVEEGAFLSATISLAAGAGALAASVAVPADCPGSSCAAVQVHRWTGASFEQVGGDPAGGAPARIVGGTRVGLGPGGNPVVAWDAQDATGFYVTVSEWDGATWHPGELWVPGPVNPISLAMGPGGGPVFAASVADLVSGTAHAYVFGPNR